MASFVYKTAVKHNSSEHILNELRQRVQELRREYPELVDCSLADLGLQVNRNDVGITFYFERT